MGTTDDPKLKGCSTSAVVGCSPFCTALPVWAACGERLRSSPDSWLMIPSDAALAVNESGEVGVAFRLPSDELRVNE